MIKKIILTFLLILIIICVITLYLVKTHEVKDLFLDYSKNKNGVLTLYNSSDKKIGEYTCENKDNCFLSISVPEAILDNKILTDETKKTLDTTIPIMGDYAFIFDNNKNNLVNLKTKKIINTYNSVKYLNNNYISLKNEDNLHALAYYNEEGITLLSDYIYDYIGKSDYSKNFLVKEKEECYLINNSNNKVSASFSNILSYTDEKIVKKDKTSYYLLNYKNEKLLRDGYTMIKLDDDYSYIISNNLLSVYDKEERQINKEVINLGVVVNFKNYYIYNKDYKLLNVDSVFTTKKQENKLIVYANNKKYEIGT